MTQYPYFKVSKAIKKETDICTDIHIITNVLDCIGWLYVPALQILFWHLCVFMPWYWKRYFISILTYIKIENDICDRWFYPNHILVVYVIATPYRRVKWFSTFLNRITKNNPNVSSYDGYWYSPTAIFMTRGNRLLPANKLLEYMQMKNVNK